MTARPLAPRRIPSRCSHRSRLALGHLRARSARNRRGPLSQIRRKVDHEVPRGLDEEHGCGDPRRRVAWCRPKGSRATWLSLHRRSMCGQRRAPAGAVRCALGPAQRAEIIGGASGKRKVVEVRGISEAEVVARLAAASGVGRTEAPESDFASRSCRRACVRRRQAAASSMLKTPTKSAAPMIDHTVAGVASPPQRRKCPRPSS